MADQTSSSKGMLTILRDLMKTIHTLKKIRETMKQRSWEDQFRAGENVRLLSIRDEINAALEEEDKRLPSLYSLKEKVICTDFTASNILLDNINGIKIHIKDDDWDGKMTSQVQDKSTGCNLNKYVKLDEPFNLDERKKAVRRVSCFLSPLDIADYYRTRKYEDDLLMQKKYGTKKDVENDDWDGKKTSQLQDKFTNCNLNNYVELDEPFNLEEHKKALQRVSSSFSLLDIANFYKTQKYEDDLLMQKIYGTKKDVENDDWDGKKTSQLQDKFTGCKLNKYEEPFSEDKRKETVQRVISCLIATVVFFWFMFYTFTQSSIMQLQPLHKEHGPIFIWSSLVEPFCFTVLVWAIATSIVVGSSSSRMQSAMLMFWAILMLVKSAKSITEVYVPILGILFTGCYMFVEKQR